MYRCKVCGYTSLQWLGRCPSCGSWNTFEYLEDGKKRGRERFRDTLEFEVYRLSEIPLEEDIRLNTGIEELNRVLGGGLVKGSSVLIAGEPGVGKSTLMLQLAANIDKQGYSVLYISAEESPAQIRMRSVRLNLSSSGFKISPVNILESVVSLVDREAPDVLIVDSLQTVFSSEVEGSSGGVAQIRKVASVMNSLAKEKGVSVFMVGHVTKGGAIAGPKMVEHLVDVVLTFSGDRNSNLRILRARKNRFGSVNETGVFEMTSGGLVAVSDVATLFVNELPTAGSARGIVLEGSRLFLVEVGTLVAHTQMQYPRRISRGFDPARLYMLSAVLEKHLGLKLSNRDVLASVVSGFRVNDPSFDLAVVAAIISSLYDRVIPPSYAFAAEVSLTGSLRKPYRLEERKKMAQRLGIKDFVYPGEGIKNISDFFAFLKQRIFK